ncbi:MAG: tetratricopeptide repeat protein [Muribaculaceae bacterium]|nr:tetratricopeptide repeat protein [Muribaculaceae bacterium]
MKLSRIFAAVIIAAASAFGANAQRAMNPITKAMMDVYQQQLLEDPKDYETYFRRANEYYNHDQYLRALSDVENAIRYTPATDKDLLFQEYSLRGNIYYMNGKYAEALTDLNKALELDPTSYVTIYLIANTQYELGDLQNARTTYRRLQRINNRSAEALFGLARIAARENNLGLANDLSNEAVDLAPSSADSYVRRAAVRKLMGSNQGAVEDLLVAISTDKSNPLAIAELVSLSNSDYTAVMNGLSAAIRTAPNQPIFLYLRATIAMAHHRYQAALTDFQKIIDLNLYDYAGLHDSMALCHLALCHYPEALQEANFAIGSADDNSPYYVTRSRIRRAMGDDKLALESADMAVEQNNLNNEALIQKAWCFTDAGKKKDAAALLGEVVLNDDTNPYYLLTRATLLSADNQRQGAQSVATDLLDLPSPSATDVKSLHGFALLLLDKPGEGVAWIEDVLAATPDNDGSLHYNAACFYAHQGNLDRAFECMESALRNGYASLYDWKVNRDGLINVEPLRADPRFADLMSKYDYLFL